MHCMADESGRGFGLPSLVPAGFCVLGGITGAFRSGWSGAAIGGAVGLVVGFLFVLVLAWTVLLLTKKG